MSITPIEEEEESHRGDDSAADERRSGVRALVGSLVSTVLLAYRRLLAWIEDPVGAAPQRGDTASGSQLRVSGQRRLGTGADESTERREGPPPLPDGTEVRAEREDNELHVYDPERSDAFIKSDTWEDAEP